MNSSSSCCHCVDTSNTDATEGLPQIRSRSGSEILARLSRARLTARAGSATWPAASPAASGNS